MAKKPDFAYYISKFLTEFLSGTKNYSINTIRSYRDTFKLLLIYFEEKHSISAHKMQIENITLDALRGFTEWLTTTRGSGIRSVNIRLAAIHAFFKYLQSREPKYLFQCQQVMSVEMARTEKKMIGFLSVDELKLLFSQISESSPLGRRDSAMLYLLYDTGARVQELCDLRVRDMFLSENPHVILHGKGNKYRYVPIVVDVAQRIQKYMDENNLSMLRNPDMPLFFNKQRQKLTRAGVSYIIAKYADKARKLSPCFPEKITPHIFRHTKAMHLCQAGIDIIYIRDILGHVDLATTEIYAKMNVELLRDALENAYPELPTNSFSDWTKDDSLMSFLKSL